MNSQGDYFLAITKDKWHLFPNIQPTIFHHFEIMNKVAIKLSIRKWKAESLHLRLHKYGYACTATIISDRHAMASNVASVVLFSSAP